jgi:hypothetical protein
LNSSSKGTKSSDRGDKGGGEGAKGGGLEGHANAGHEVEARLGEVQERSRENSPEDQTIQLGKPMVRTKVEGHIGLVRTEWMTKVRI